MIAVALALTGVLLAIAGVHGLWARGSTWPAGSEQSLARAVVGSVGIKRMPSPAACYGVALALITVSSWPVLHTVFGLAKTIGPLDVLIGTGFAVVFSTRGFAAYAPAWRSRLPEQPFATLDRRLYGPLCLAIGCAFAALTIWG